MDLISIVVIFVCILVSMTLHEAMHAYVSYWLGDDTAKNSGRLTINPLAHIDPIMTVLLPLMLAMAGLPPFGAAKPIPFNPYRLKYGEIGAALVGLAGPLTNLALAMLAGGILRLFGQNLYVNIDGVLYLFTWVNVSFFLFNIIPFPPLDGSSVLYAVAPDVIRRFLERIESMGMMAILLFFLLFSVFLVSHLLGCLTLS